MAKLHFLGDNFGGRSYELVLEKTTVGRGEQNTLTIHDHSLSSVHCEILVNGSEVIVRDLNSSNGTFVDGARLHNQQCQVKAGQIIRFGSVEARLELDRQSDTTFDEHTAVYAHSRAVRDQRRAQKNPANPAMTLDPSGESTAQEHTVLMRRQDELTQPLDHRPSAEWVEDTQKPPGRARVWIAVGILAVIAVILLIWLARR